MLVIDKAHIEGWGPGGGGRITGLHSEKLCGAAKQIYGDYKSPKEECFEA